MLGCVCVCVSSGRALPGRMSSQQREAEGRSGNDAESAERYAEVSLSNRLHPITLTPKPSALTASHVHAYFTLEL